MTLRLVATGLFLWLLLCALGCSGTPADAKPHSVQGRIVENGKNWSAAQEGLPPGDAGILVEFCQLDEADNIVDAHGAVIDPQDGTFTVPGPNGKGIPAGKYRIAVHVGAFGQPDKLKETLSREKSKLTYQVPTSGEVVIDIGKKTLVQ